MESLESALVGGHSDNDLAGKQEVRPCPVKDCNLPIDITLQSSDGVRFRTHMKNLEHYSDGFPQAGSVELDSDIPILEETADVLDLMLQFMHHTRQPDLSEVKFRLLSALAEAVEKYMIYSAMSICNMHMSLQVLLYPIDVLIYAFKHDYTKLVNKVAPLTTSVPSEMVVIKAKTARIHDSFLVTWFRYRDIRTNLARSVLNQVPPMAGFHKGAILDCGLWEPYKTEVLLLSAKANFPGPKDIYNTMKKEGSELESCSLCHKRADQWERQALFAANEVPLFFSVGI